MLNSIVERVIDTIFGVIQIIKYEGGDQLNFFGYVSFLTN